jgi:hypothetical protein
MRQTETSVRTASGQMRAMVYYPDAEPPLPGIVLVDDSGDCAAPCLRHSAARMTRCR